MVKIRILRGNDYQYISLQEMLELYYSEAPKGWFDFLVKEIDNAIKINTPEELDNYRNQRGNFIPNNFNPDNLRKFYKVLKLSKYDGLFDDDILKFISYIKEMDFFNIINYELDETNPDLDSWISSNNPFRYTYTENEMAEAYSMMDLISLKNGMNGIRGMLLRAMKKIN